jgi:subtilisin family serine protease
MKKRSVQIFALLMMVLCIGLISADEGKQKLIVKYKGKIDDNNIKKLRDAGAEIKYQYNIIQAVALEVDEENISDILSDLDVISVGLDEELHISLDDSAGIINADDVWLTGINGSGVRVCIPDTGIHDGHPDLPSLVAWKDFVNHLSSPYDDHGHGTHVAGIVGSRDETFRGIAHGSDLMGAKICNSFGSCLVSDFIASLEWCVDEGADVISLSLGGGLFDEPCDFISFAEASNNASDQGVVVIAASGNDGDAGRLAAPACASKVIAVGSTDKNDVVSSFSNGGPLLDVVAPGQVIHTTHTNNGFVNDAGTSMSVPHASGVAALLLQQNSSLTPDDIRTILRDTAVDLGTPGFDNSYGYGRVDALAAYESLLPSCVDNDGDGVFDFDEGICPEGNDICPDSVEDDIELNPNQYAQNIDFGEFEVGKENNPSLVYDMEITGGCTCKQIIEKLGKGEGHAKKGCSPSVMEEWTGLDANPDRAYNSKKGILGRVIASLFDWLG